jgi:hypothetical protein
VVVADRPGRSEASADDSGVVPTGTTRQTRTGPPPDLPATTVANSASLTQRRSGVVTAAYASTMPWP